MSRTTSLSGPLTGPTQGLSHDECHKRVASVTALPVASLTLLRHCLVRKMLMRHWLTLAAGASQLEKLVFKHDH